ncbi:MAG: Mut7-C RNAse domain-containing protein [Candidatus Micrarchaeaceae archaeon]
MRLVADVMMAKLARWLRLAGIPIQDAQGSDDSAVIRFVKHRHALLITADRRLAERAGRRRFRVLLVSQKDLDSQIAFVMKSLGLKISAMPSMICPVCNIKLRSVSKGYVRSKVPERAYKMHRKFYTCTKCGRIYWHGTHWDAIERRFRRVRRIMRAIEGSPPQPLPRLR